MTKSLKLLLSLLTVGSMFTSCIPTEQVDYTQTFKYDATSLVMGYGDPASNQLTMNTAPQIIIEQDLANYTLTIQLNALYYPGAGSLTMTSEALPFIPNVSETGTVSIQLNKPLAYFGNNVLEDFTLITLDAWMSIRFTFQGLKYVINTAATNRDGATNAAVVLYQGTTQVTTPGSATVYNNTDVKYGLNFNDGVANLYVYFMQFNDKMDTMNLLIQNLDFKMGASGYEITSSDDIIPKDITERQLVEAPDYVIKNFKAFIPYSGQSGSIGFECTDDNLQVSVTNVEIAQNLYTEQ